MRILHCVELYHPRPGGAQAVVRHISQQLVSRGHRVTVATTRLTERRDLELDGVAIEEFEVSGNAAHGIEGEVDRYRDFVIDGGFDVMMTYAAQQWTTDALLPVLDRIPYRRLLAPCGFSGLSDPAYAAYFAQLPAFLARFDGLIFHSETYQDMEFSRDAGLSNTMVIPNGASRAEFEPTQTSFRERHGIDADEPLLLTVGPHNWVKGHRLAIEAFRAADLERGTLAVIGNRPLRLGCQWDCRRRALATRLATRRRKHVIVLDCPRPDVLDAYRAADLFVFGSQVECSPLVLFEAAASSTPFISTDCGNAAEIAEWTGAGVVVPSSKRDGKVTATPSAMAEQITRLCGDSRGRKRMAERGRARWLADFTWDRIAGLYEDAYERTIGARSG